MGISSHTFIAKKFRESIIITCRIDLTRFLQVKVNFSFFHKSEFFDEMNFLIKLISRNIFIQPFTLFNFILTMLGNIALVIFDKSILLLQVHIKYVQKKTSQQEIRNIHIGRSFLWVRARDNKSHEGNLCHNNSEQRSK